jgi:2-dehydropantoate 2-reductase
MKKVLVVGCGAIGSLFAAHLAKGGETEVYAFDASQAHVDAIERDGLRLTGAAELQVRLAKASTNAAEFPVCDYGVVATKAIHTACAIEAAARCFDSHSVVCSVQNGVGNEEIIAEQVKYVARGTTFPAGHIVGPGHINFDIQGDTWIGPFEPTSTPTERVEELAGYFTRSGMNTMALKDARGAQWTKLIFNAATNPVGALTRLHHGAASRLPATGALFEALIDEGEAVAKAMGIELHGDPRALVAKGANAPGKHKASMLQDALALRTTEVDFMNGAIVKWGEKYGVPTPLNRTMWALIKGMEHSWTEP